MEGIKVGMGKSSEMLGGCMFERDVLAASIHSAGSTSTSMYSTPPSSHALRQTLVRNVFWYFSSMTLSKTPLSRASMIFRWSGRPNYDPDNHNTTYFLNPYFLYATFYIVIRGDDSVLFIHFHLVSLCSATTFLNKQNTNT